MVTFGCPIREKGCKTKEGRFEEQKEKDKLYNSKVDLNEEGRAPSMSQVSPHGRTCATLR
jgi:hypothetical protein